MMISGSCLRIERRAAAKVTPAFSLTWICATPGRSYSMGSSTVMIFTAGCANACRIAYIVVVFPDPVGPVKRIMPFGRRIISSMIERSRFSIPRSSSVSNPCPLSSRRIAMRSPNCTGTLPTRISTALFPTVIPMRPSWGAMCSAMSIFAMTLMRLVSGAWCPLGRRRRSWSTPSTRKRMRTLSSYGST